VRRARAGGEEVASKPSALRAVSKVYGGPPRSTPSGAVNPDRDGGEAGGESWARAGGPRARCHHRAPWRTPPAATSLVRAPVSAWRGTMRARASAAAPSASSSRDFNLLRRTHGGGERTDPLEIAAWGARAAGPGARGARPLNLTDKGPTATRRAVRRRDCSGWAVARAIAGQQPAAAGRRATRRTSPPSTANRRDAPGAGRCQGRRRTACTSYHERPARPWGTTGRLHPDGGSSTHNRAAEPGRNRLLSSGHEPP